MSGSNGRVVVAANSLWNIVNFRGGLVRALKAAGYEPIVVAPADTASTAGMNALGVEHVDIEINRSGTNPAADVRLIQAYLRTLRKKRPVAFLGFTIKPNIYGCLAARLLHIAAIPNVSGLGTVFVRGGPLMWLVSRMYRFALAKAPVVFFQNDEDLRLFVSRGLVRAEQARRLPGSGVDLERFSNTPLPTGPVSFLLVARLLTDKGIREYVEAARHVRQRWPEVRFQLLGPVDHGNPTAIAEDELAAWSRDGAIEYLGQAEDVRPHITQATVVVLPSYYREGVPRSLLEGAAMGRPLITTDFPGCRDAVAEGINGYLCAPGDAQSLAATMIRMLELTPGQLIAMGQASRELAVSRFDEQLVVGACLEALAAATASTAT